VKLDKRIALFVALAGVFVTCLVVGDLIGVKVIGGKVPVTGWNWATTVGMLAFPVTFLLTDLLNEFYGKQAARFVTWVGFGAAVLAFLLVTAATAVPFADFTKSPTWDGTNEASFNNVFGGGQRMLIASLTAYLVASLVDISVFHLLKRLTKERFLWLRATGSTLVSQLIDTSVVTTVAWYGIRSLPDIFTMVASGYALKVFIAVAMTPAIYAGHAVVEKWLHMRPVLLDDAGEVVEHPGDPVRALDAARPD
jgi:uncharacterized integral membrane protein (TIGR00697 family)